MSGTQQLALIRGINVGGKNMIRMADLRLAFEELGFGEVRTYIQTGNVFFRAPRERRVALSERLESNLSARFGIELKVVLLSERRLRDVVESAPEGFGAEGFNCDVIFLRPPLGVRETLGSIETREGIDQVWSGPEVLYFSRLASRASGSRLSKFVMTPAYKEVTIRSWRTVTKLEAMLEAREEGW
ncbi:DUF1697 domain-containing protein [Thermoleophilia bacterium SCSIO 60948]|nr:DUF1697 domain-containing protein [Thermoleophilia bacterium SCSIO 60948]